MMLRRHNLSTRPRRAGITLAEVVVCTLLVGLLLIGSLETLGQLVRSRQISSDKARATQLAMQLLVECVDKEYVESGGAPFLGMDAGENTGDRLLFDDVDDFDLWNAAPPQSKDGTALPNLPGWQRDVAVDWVELSDPTVISATDQGVKRITVVVRKDGDVFAEAVALRSDQAPGA